MHSTFDCDTLIIGGGPGGSTLGTFLSKAGQRVRLLEKEVFPRFKIGESLIPCGNDILKASGVWEKIEKAGFIPKLGAEFCTGNASKTRSVWFDNGIIPGYGRTFQVERAKFDHLLLKHAQESGCQVSEGTRVESVNFGKQGVITTYQQGDTTSSIRSRWIVDASGRDTFLGRYLRLPRKELDVPKRIATYAHFKGVYRNSGDAAGHITVVRLQGGWFWLIPLDVDKTSVGMVQECRTLQESGLTPIESFEKTIQESTELRARLRDSQRMSEFHTTSNYSYTYETQAGPRMLMIGDAGGFIDPIFSSGVLIALKSAQLAKDYILNANTERGFTPRDQIRFTSEVQGLRNGFERMIRTYYQENGFEVFINPQSRFRIVAAVNSLLAGHTHMKLQHWWRIQMFYLVCAIQKWIPLAPRLNFAESHLDGSKR
jgi:flavin-dependent dehydrogenase